MLLQSEAMQQFPRLRATDFTHLNRPTHITFTHTAVLVAPLPYLEKGIAVLQTVHGTPDAWHPLQQLCHGALGGFMGEGGSSKREACGC